MTLCSAAGCKKLAAPGSIRCGQCAPAASPGEQRRGTTAERGYDADHRRLRIECFERDGWKCRECGWEPQIVKDYRFVMLDPPTNRVLAFLARQFTLGGKHLHADHVLRIEDRPDLRLELDNLQSLCNECHNRKSRREQAA